MQTENAQSLQTKPWITGYREHYPRILKRFDAWIAPRENSHNRQNAQIVVARWVLLWLCGLHLQISY
jgi:hypothetical protein